MKLYTVGFGAGNADGMTLAAKKAIEKCDLIVGYTAYTELLKVIFPDKEYYQTPMKQEVERCRHALQEAQNGKNVAVVCSGDAGVYGMASLLYELSSDYKNVEIKVIPGVTAAISGAALLGAPLTNDFAVVSLSDLLTESAVIEKRLECAAMADFVICLYNPASKKRGEHLKNACDIILKYRPPETVCGIAQNIGREGEVYKIMSLSELRDAKTDMFTTVFVGNLATKKINGKMVTPRGYKNV